jgi:hypothetical protein
MRQNKEGRPTIYKKEYNNQARKLSLLGATDKDIADFFEISKSTLNEWKNKHPLFKEALNKGKIIADANVASSLYKRALGFKYDEVTFEKIDNKVNVEISKAGDIKANDTYKKKVVTKLVAPDTSAASLWLRNRQKDLWRDRHEFKLDPDSLTEEQLDFLINEIVKRSR